MTTVTSNEKRDNETPARHRLVLAYLRTLPATLTGVAALIAALAALWNR